MKSERRKRMEGKKREGSEESFRSKLIALSTRNREENRENRVFLWLTLYCAVLAVNSCCLVCWTYKSNDGDFVCLLIFDRDGDDVATPKPTGQIKQTELLFKKSLLTLLFDLLCCLQSVLSTHWYRPVSVFIWWGTSSTETACLKILSIRWAKEI